MNFSNKSQLGSFGEFVYKSHCESLGFHIERTNYCHTDFLLRTGESDRPQYIDVKSTLSNKKSYKGTRYHEDISYDLIVILDNELFLVPDNKSPLNKKGIYLLGSISEWMTRWQQRTEIARTRKFRLEKKNQLELKDIFARAGYPRIRIVERGDASGKRWSGTVDNLPGSSKIVDGHDVTLFIEYGCEGFVEKVASIYLIWHHLLHNRKITMSKPNSRQSNKGIVEVVDLKAFKRERPELVFDGLEELKHFIESSIMQ